MLHHMSFSSFVVSTFSERIPTDDYILSLYVGLSSSLGILPSPNIWCIFLSFLYIAVGAPYRPFYTTHRLEVITPIFESALFHLCFPD